MQARIITYLSALAFYAASMFVVALDARAHGEAEWIASNPLFVDENGTHCCSTDCGRAPAAMFREAPEGIYVTQGGDEVLVPRRLVGRGLYVSKDGDWWRCGAKPRCVFKPRREG